jgi:DNA repair protein RadC
LNRTPPFLSGNGGYFYFRREANEQVLHEPQATKGAGGVGSASKAREYRQLEACSGGECVVQGAACEVAGGCVQAVEDADREKFVVVCLDTKNQPTAINVCHIGSLNASIVHPREVFKSAILANAASVLVAHNHPSTDPTPSREDIEVTKRLSEAGKVIGIDVLDHLIVCPERFVSLKEKGYV